MLAGPLIGWPQILTVSLLTLIGVGNTIDVLMKFGRMRRWLVLSLLSAPPQDFPLSNRASQPVLFCLSHRVSTEYLDLTTKGHSLSCDNEKTILGFLISYLNIMTDPDVLPSEDLSRVFVVVIFSFSLCLSICRLKQFVLPKTFMEQAAQLQ